MLKETNELEGLETDYPDINELDDIDPPMPLINPLRPQYKNHQAQALSRFLDTFGTQKTPAEFYRHVFPAGMLSDVNAQESGKYACRVYKSKNWSQYVNDDLNGVLSCTPEESASMNYIAYAGRGTSSKQAFELYAFVFRVFLPDEISPFYVESCLEALKVSLDRYGNQYPRNPRICPTYVLTDKDYSSVYFCYVLREPIPMFHHLHTKLQRLYDALSRAIHHLWDIGIWDSTQKRFTYKYECKKPMPKSIFQQYPVVGSKLGNGECLAYEVGKKYDLEELNMLVPKVNRIQLYDPKMTLEEAKEKYGDWVERRIIQKRKPSGSRFFKPSIYIYNWFIRQITENKDIIRLATMEALASYAVKNKINEGRFLADLADVRASLSVRFSEEDVSEHETRAKEYFEEDPLFLHYVKTEEVEEWTGIHIEPTKRNYKTRKEHLKGVHAKYSQEQAVLEWLEANPEGTQTACSKDLGISRKTVSKWWPTRKKRTPTQKETKVKNPCPHCGAEMVKTKVGPHFWAQKAKFYARIDKDCPNCGHHIHGKPYACQRPA